MSDEINAAPDSGQAVPTPSTEQSGPSEPFYTSGDNTFQTREDLDRAFKSSVMMQKDYTRKTQDIARQRQSYENLTREAKEALKKAQEKASEFNDWDAFITERPDLYEQLRAAKANPPDANTAFQKAQKYSDDKTGELAEKMEKFERYMADQERERELNTAYEFLGSKYDNVDRDAVQKVMEEMSSGGLNSILDTAYQALMGRSGPAEVEQKVAEAQAAKNGARLMSPRGGAKAAPASSKEFDSLDAVAEAAKLA